MCMTPVIVVWLLMRAFKFCIHLCIHSLRLAHLGKKTVVLLHLDGN